MKSDLLDKASEIVSDPLVLVNLVSQRVRQLNSGRSPLIATRPSMGVADIALLEIVEDRYDAGSILLTSQVPIDRWHDIVGNPTLADAILDRVIHNAYRIELAGESMRKRRMPEPSA